MGTYDSQRRGDRGAYQRYLAGMDATMRQKVALTAAHLLARGTVADMGMGSGAGSHALAALYPELRVVGVDVSPEMVALARERWRLPNLSFQLGDIAAPCFPPGTLDGVFDSSVLHHVTSFSGYDHSSAARALAVQAGELAIHGVLIVRDFVAPEGGPVELELPDTDGTPDGADPRHASTAALFERFAGEFRSLAPARGFPFTPLPSARAGWRRYRVDRRHAVEFLLRKDYRADWEAEVKEEYLYFTQAQFEDAFARLGLRVLASTPIWNPWILQHRFAGRYAWRDDTGELEHPPTNYLCAAEKVPPDEGVRFRETGPAGPPAFLSLHHHLDRRTGHVKDLVRRPNLTLDIVPWFRSGDRDGGDGGDGGDLFILARQSYPRPILATQAGTPWLDGALPAPYVTEPLNAVQTDRPVGETVEQALRETAGIHPDQILGFTPGADYYPSPGGLQEEVRSVFVEIQPLFVQTNVPPRSGFSTSGRARAIEARQLLRAAQVGGLPDARLELNVHDLLARLGLDPGPWIGETLDVAEAAGPAPPAITMSALASRPPRRAFAPTGESAGFLELRHAWFEELDSADRVLARRSLELVLPARHGLQTIATAPLLRHAGAVHIGVADDDLPAAQAFSGNSNLLVAPAWRLPRHIATWRAARAFLAERLLAEHGIVAGRTWSLGGRYHPSPGVTPEAVFPLAVEVRALLLHKAPLHWPTLADVVASRAHLRDGHLRTVALRAAHALATTA